MYQQFFDLKDAPFSIAPNPRYLYMSERHREALAHLIYGLNSDGAFILLSGDVGTGKTTVSRCLLEQLSENTELALIFNPKLTVLELLASICGELQINCPRDLTSVKRYVDYINRYLLAAHGLGKKVVILIDEAQNLSMDVLEQLRLLTNLETNERKLLQIILLGQPELLDMLAQPELSQLAQRITARYHLSPLNPKEVCNYINHRLHVAGAKKHLFSVKSMQKIAELSQGVPRIINVLCDRAMLGSYVQNKYSIDKKTVLQAAKEILPAYKIKNKKFNKKIFSWAFSSVVVLSVVIILVFLPKFQLLKTLPLIEKKSEDIKPADKVKEIEKKIDSKKTNTKRPLFHDTLENISWPEESVMLRSNLLAFKALLTLWGLHYQADKNGSPCFYVQSQGLACMQRQASLAVLRDYNRPAVLKLYNKQEQVLYVVLKYLKMNKAYINIATKDIVISTDELQKYWYGDFTLLWKKPPFYIDSLKPADESESIVWLTQALNKLYPDNKILALRQYKDDLLEKVRRFQIEQGLVADGVVGVKTLTHLNDVLKINVPRLQKVD